MELRGVAEAALGSAADTIRAIGLLVAWQATEGRLVAALLGDPVAQQRTLNLPLGAFILRPVLKPRPFEVLDGMDPAGVGVQLVELL